MAFTASIEIGLQYLSGNTIPLIVNVTPGHSVVYRVTDAATSVVIFSGLISSISGKQIVNINRLFNLHSVGDGVKTYKVELLHENAVLQTATISVYPGAISKRLYRELAKKSLNIFNTKLDPAEQNFLLSTRSFSKVLAIPEDEILPIPYYRKGKVFSVAGTAVDFSAAAQAVEFLNIGALRKSSYNTSKKLLSAFDVVSGNVTAVSIIVTEVAEPHTHFIKFRNSLGAQEMIALENIIDFTPAFDKQEVGIYDHLTGDVLNVPYSVGYKSKFKAQLRPIGAGESLFALDMLLSREQFLVTPSGEFQVKVSAPEQVFQTTSGEPLSISVEIEAVDEERYYSPLDMDRLGFIYENIFTHEFTLQYT